MTSKSLRWVLATAAMALAAPGFAEESALDRAYAEVVAARAELQKAETARKQGEEPLPGDRQGVVTSPGEPQRSRLSDEYWREQKRLEQDVERAQSNLDRALKRWNELK